MNLNDSWIIKCKHAGCLFEEVNESFTTQTCSCCLSISNNSPKGRAGLAIREWTCGACNTTHDSDLMQPKHSLSRT